MGSRGTLSCCSTLFREVLLVHPGSFFLQPWISGVGIGRLEADPGISRCLGASLLFHWDRTTIHWIFQVILTPLCFIFHFNCLTQAE